MNWLNQLNLVPKNFIVANIVDIMKEDPETGVNRVYKLANDFLPDDKMKESVAVVKTYYDTHPSVKLLVKNICYNTNKLVLNHTLQNLCVNAGLDGHEKRKKAQATHRIEIPPLLSLVVTSENQKASPQQISAWVSEGKNLGIHLFLLKGEGVLYTPSYLNVYQQHKDVQFLLISESREIQEVTTDVLEKIPNIIPILNCQKTMNDPVLLKALLHLKKANLLYGVNSFITGEDIKTLVSPETTRSMIRHGARVHLCVYNADTKTVTKDQLMYVENWANHIRQTMPYLPLTLKVKSSGHYVLSLDIQGHLYEYQVVQAVAPQIQGGLVPFLAMH